MKEIAIMVVGNKCPNCGSEQFSISCPESGMSRPYWPPGVLGLVDCRSCHNKFFVKLSSGLEKSIQALISCNAVPYQEVMKVLFPPLEVKIIEGPFK